LWLWRFGDSEHCRGRSVTHAWEALCRTLKCMLDGREARISFMPAEFLFVELLIALSFVVVFMMSVMASFSPKIVPIGRPDSPSPSLAKKCIDAYIKEDMDYAKGILQGHADRKRGLTIVSYMNNCMWFSSYTEEFFEVFFEVVFNQRYHAIVLGFVCIRIFQAFEFSSKLSWLPITIKIAASKMINFLIMYFVVVVSFAILMHISFGRLYTQFETLSKACLALMLYSFGMTERAEDGTHPFIEYTGTDITMYLLLYTIIVVTIGLQFFTTIILDAYARACDPDFDDKELEVAAISNLAFLGPCLNIPPEIFDGPPSVKKRRTSAPRLSLFKLPDAEGEEG
jgi:hypothetical protein